MDSNSLYQSCLKMINDKYNLTEFSKEIFMDIYSNIYKNSNVITNELNKNVLIEIKNYIETNNNNNLNNNLNNPNNHKEEDLELKIREAEAIRASISKMNIMIKPTSITDIEQQSSVMTPQKPINITNYQQPLNLTKYKTFIVNTTKNNFRVVPKIDIHSHLIYPSVICLPSDIKFKTPYIILIINDGIKQSSYTYTPTSANNSPWDIWQPVINDYIDIILTNNNWIITLIDYLNNPIDMNEYQTIVNDVLLINDNYLLNINKPFHFLINDKIKIIKNDGYIADNEVIGMNDNKGLIINKNDLVLNDFINSRIINYKHNISITFKYHLKQQE